MAVSSDRREFLSTLGMALGTAAWASGAQAQTHPFPAKPVHTIIPYAAGSTPDVLMRILAPGLEQRWGQSLVIEFKPGGGTVIGTTAGAKAPADGYTLVMVANSLVISAKLHKALPYDPLKAFAPVALLVNSPQILAVGSSSPYQTLGEYLDIARTRPGALSVGTIGPGTTQHIAVEMLKRSARADLTYVPFSGGNLAVNAVVGGHVTAALGNLADMSAQISGGLLRPLAVTTRERVETFKSVPTVAELGHPDYEAVVWFGLAVPAGTPREVVAKLSEGFNLVLNDPQTRQRLLRAGLIPTYMGPAEMAEHITRKYEQYSRVIDDAGIKLE